MIRFFAYAWVVDVALLPSRESDFKVNATPNGDDYSGFYKLEKVLNKAFK
ncbi:MAG: hypothetical protein ACI82Z_001696 [Cellvibrionaceae bacterium]